MRKERNNTHIITPYWKGSPIQFLKRFFGARRAKKMKGSEAEN